MSNRDEIDDNSLAKAVRLFHAFHAKAPSRGKIVGLRSKEKTVEALEVGAFYGIAYIADGKKYFHKFNKRNRPLVFVSSDGRQIYILKGGYRFTDRGFIG